MILKIFLDIFSRILHPRPMFLWKDSPILDLNFARIVMGTALISLGLMDLKSAKGEALRVDEFFMANLSRDATVAVRRATAVVMMLAGLGICLSCWFST